MQLINDGLKDFEFVADMVHYIIKPGEILDVEDWKGRLAMRQARVLDSTYLKEDDGVAMGEPTGAYMIREVRDLDAETVNRLRKWTCPMVQTGHCAAKPFDSMDALRKHLDVHLGASSDLDIEPAAALPGAKVNKK